MTTAFSSAAISAARMGLTRAALKPRLTSGTTVYEYQRSGTEFLANREHALLADDPGLGKTKMAVEACIEIGAKSILVVCPAIARRHWAAQFKTWGRGLFPRVQVFEQGYGGHAPGSVSIVGYSSLSVDTQLHRAIK